MAAPWPGALANALSAAVNKAATEAESSGETAQLIALRGSLLRRVADALDMQTMPSAPQSGNKARADEAHDEAGRRVWIGAFARLIEPHLSAAVNACLSQASGDPSEDPLRLISMRLRETSHAASGAAAGAAAASPDCADIGILRAQIAALRDETSR